MTFYIFYYLKSQIYLHILFEAKPSTNLVRFINSYKSASSRLIKK
ncbi:transposase [Methanobrevibacter sp.]